MFHLWHLISSVETEIWRTKYSRSGWPHIKTSRLQLRWWSLWRPAPYQSWEPTHGGSRRSSNAGWASPPLSQSGARSGPCPRGSPASRHPQPHPCHGTLSTRDPQRAAQKEVRQRSMARQETHPVTTHLTSLSKLLTLILPADTSGTVTWQRWTFSLRKPSVFVFLQLVVLLIPITKQSTTSFSWAPSQGRTPFSEPVGELTRKLPVVQSCWSQTEIQKEPDSFSLRLAAARTCACVTGDMDMDHRVVFLLMWWT